MILLLSCYDMCALVFWYVCSCVLLFLRLYVLLFLRSGSAIFVVVFCYYCSRVPEQCTFFLTTCRFCTEQMWISYKTNEYFLQYKWTFITEQMWTVYRTNVDRLQNKCPISFQNSQNTCVFYRTNVGFAS